MNAFVSLMAFVIDVGAEVVVNASFPVLSLHNGTSSAYLCPDGFLSAKGLLKFKEYVDSIRQQSNNHQQIKNKSGLITTRARRKNSRRHRSQRLLLMRVIIMLGVCVLGIRVVILRIMIIVWKVEKWLMMRAGGRTIPDPHHSPS